MQHLGYFRTSLMVFSIAANTLLSGCASNPHNDTLPQSSALSAVDKQLPLSYQKTELAAQIRESGLEPRFVEYWQAHMDRDWAKRFHLERPIGVLTERFYVDYHAQAWRIAQMEVQDVKIDGDRVDLKLKLTFSVREGKPFETYATDRWERTANDWLHVNNDPILTGMR